LSQTWGWHRHAPETAAAPSRRRVLKIVFN
jgi:hypothetical protein